MVLFGLYATDQDGYLAPNAYTVLSRDQLGNLLPASSSSSLPVLPSFTTVSGSTTVLVTLPNYTYAAGTTFPVLVPTAVGGVTFYGNYVVQSLVNANSFTIVSNSPATSSATGTVNGGNAYFIYNIGYGAIPTGTGYGIGPYGAGGYGTGTQVLPPSAAAPIPAIDWTLDNFGEILIG